MMAAAMPERPDVEARDPYLTREEWIRLAQLLGRTSAKLRTWRDVARFLVGADGFELTKRDLEAQGFDLDAEIPRGES